MSSTNWAELGRAARVSPGVGSPAQGLGPGSSHGGRGGLEKRLPTVRDTDMAYTPEGSRTGGSSAPVGSSSLWGTGLWSLVGHGLNLTLPSSITAVGHSGGTGAALGCPHWG